MLVLTRRENESIQIADNITIHILRIAGNRVRIGIEAPKNIPIRRSEIDPQPKHAEPTAARVLPPLSNFIATFTTNTASA